MALAPQLACAQVYKWVDESGKTHFGDSPPPQAKGLKQVELKGVYISQEQRQEAEDRAARARAQAAVPPKATAPLPPPPQLTFQQQMADYRQSQECFSQFRNVNGSLRQQAYEVCGPELLAPNQEGPREVTPSR